MPTFSLHLSFHFVQKRKNLLGCSSPGALFFSLPYHFSSCHCLSYGRLLPPGRTVKLWLKRQIWASGVSMCSVWWAASGCWSFFQYRSPPSSLLFSSLYLASWPLQRSLFSVFTSEGGWTLKPALFCHIKYPSSDLGIVLQLAAFTCSMQCNYLESNVIWWNLLDQQESWAPTIPFLSNHFSISLWRWASITWNHHACSSSGDWWSPLQVLLFHFSEQPIVM